MIASDLESLLKEHFGCKNNPFRKVDGKLTKEGMECYKQLCDVLYSVAEITGERIAINRILNTLDEIEYEDI